jgi:hypothetical protein
MHLVTPEIMVELCGLSLAVLVCAAGLGLALWLLGWWSHRFWIVITTTVAAGIYGLQEAATLRSNPLVVVAALLLSVAAGILALHLVRLVAFVIGGFCGLILVQTLLPGFEQPLAVFVVSGLVSLVLFRWFLMALTSLLGATLVCYAGLAILNQRGALDAVAWSDQGATLLNWICGLMAVMGFAFQYLFERRGRAVDDEDGDDAGMLFSFSRLYRRAG